MDAERIIEWITHVMAIELTTHQENMIRLHCDGGDWSYRSYARGGYKFAEVLVDAYREAALIPDHVSLSSVEEK